MCDPQTENLSYIILHMLKKLKFKLNGLNISPDDKESVSFAYFGDFGSTNAVSLPKLQVPTRLKS